jgi:hypothetical protein
MPLSSSYCLDSLLCLDAGSQSCVIYTRDLVEKVVDYDEEILRFKAATPETLALVLRSLDDMIVANNLLISYRVQLPPDQVEEGSERLDESFLEFLGSLLTRGSQSTIIRNVVITGSKRMVDMFNVKLEELIFQRQNEYSASAISIMIVDRRKLPSEDSGMLPEITCGIGDSVWVCGGNLEDEVSVVY